MSVTIEVNLADILKRKHPQAYQALAKIEFSNSLRYDEFWSHEFNIADLLAEKQLIGIIWNVQLILDYRPDLTRDQAWLVLQECERYFDEEITDSMQETIRLISERMFPKPPGKATLKARLLQLGQLVEALPEGEDEYSSERSSIAAELAAIASLAKGD